MGLTGRHGRHLLDNFAASVIHANLPAGAQDKAHTIYSNEACYGVYRALAGSDTRDQDSGRRELNCDELMQHADEASEAFGADAKLYPFTVVLADESVLRPELLSH